MEAENRNGHRKTLKSLNDYARYSGLAFQMIGILLLGVFGGIQLDKWLHLAPLFTVVLSFVSVVLAIYYGVKDLLRTKKNNHEPRI